MMTQPSTPVPSPDFLGWTPDTWSAAAGVATVLIAAVAAAVAYRQVREARRLRVEQADPYVAIFLESVSEVSEQLVDVVVKNFGQTAAFDVRFVADPSLARSRGSNGQSEPVGLPDVIRTLVPGQQWRTFFDHGPSRAKTELPNLYAVTVTFTSRHRRVLRDRWKTTEHRYVFTLDLAALEVRHHVTQYGVHHAAKALREIRTTIKEWSEGTGLSKGVSVYSRDGDARDLRTQEEFAEFRRQQAEASKLREDPATPSEPDD